ncbi:Nucleotidyltransferase domain-containing protein [Sulfidibacter corallicola]|uniref:Nucleotidyltransferase domain-containing protein n=1 Tax=Sulfidibacter corallicola TaxID=2818388 RepID=A0A8A4U5D5_SULCO|nr:nucleotidyltransferase domain-containing protein [Sulfidibacter corallicola]QTD53945.1 nucleotidyltransferase domain-containing protein [Sulfidibacter corallicola]
MTKKEERFTKEHLIPVGTKVVTTTDVEATNSHPAFPKGAVGMIAAQPDDQTAAYRVKLVDGQEGMFRRDQVTTLSRFQARGIDEGLSEERLWDCVIYRCIVGSRAYGLDHDASDTDIRGIYLPPAELHWSLFALPEQLEDKTNELCFWELQKFLNLALKANPNILECLYTPLITFKTPVTEALLAIREAFLSKLAYQTYNGYVLSQFKKMTQRLARGEEHVNWKHAMHLIRLLYAGIGILRDRRVMVRVGEEKRPLLSSIRHGELSWEAVDTLRTKLHAEFEEAFLNCTLPDRPDYDTVNQFLIEARRSATKTLHSS